MSASKAAAGYADKIEGQSFTDQEDGFYKVDLCVFITASLPRVLSSGDQIVEWGLSGICEAIATWNAGLVYFSGYVGAALASGNTIVLKASEKLPFDTLLVADLIPDAGFPPGVINIISGCPMRPCSLPHPRYQQGFK